MDFIFMWEAFLTLLPGLPLTLELAATSIVAGGILAAVISLIAVIGGPIGRGFHPGLRLRLSRVAAARTDVSDLLWPWTIPTAVCRNSGFG